jgi:hypothetical protein
MEAAHLLLSGDDVPLAARPASPGAVHQELRRIMSTDELWSPPPALFPAGPAAQLAILDGYAVAYCLLGTGVVFIAAVGVSADRFRIRTVLDWTEYDHDASASFPLGDLKK